MAPPGFERQAELYELLASHPDPLWREMGEQLKGGKMRTIDVFAIPAYRDHLEEGLERAKERQGELIESLWRAVDDPSVYTKPARRELDAAGPTDDAEAPETETGIRACPACGRVIRGPACPYCC
ncbi:hypothetical protein [Plantactinospora sp. CA-290183]|uniref:hypothetical protein n=1 Tax=Plantactinospora sp. CA-290183 TaxID=3240006 RepID=UPI003D90384B